jgi:hypothetical protein
VEKELWCEHWWRACLEYPTSCESDAFPS